MADDSSTSHRRDPIKSSGKERRESLVRAKRLCRVGATGDGDVPVEENDMLTDKAGFLLDAQTSSSEFPPVEAALKAGAIPLLVQCLSFGSPDEQLLEAAWDEEVATEVAWVVVYLSALSNFATGVLVKSDVLHLLVERLATSNSLQLLIPVLRSLGNLVAGDSHTTSTILVPGHEITDGVIKVLVKCLKSDHRVLKKEASWVLSNIAAGSIEHKQMIYSSEAVALLLRLLSTAPFDIRKEVAYVLGNLCVAPTVGEGKPNLVEDHLVSLVQGGCLSGFIDLVRSADIEAARLGLQFTELVLRGIPNGDGPKLVEQEDGIDAMERYQFHENEDLRNMANGLVDKYFGEDYGIDE
ncbi:Importin subunit alpha-9 [Hibiscus syriacus]|uniref:Importin subunit alpha-9 n=1 Tax=Hibiscus syriacus TaxID=106335 RepID=A0A6A2Z108_HIBSY|nr:Importin subunit alpha-9 [Hibiscus syriacus]